MPKKFEKRLKQLAAQVQNRSPTMTDELITMQGFLALIVDIQLRGRKKQELKSK